MPARRVAAEFLGSAFLLAAVVGSGIMGERLSGGNAALTLLANSLATAAALSVLILTFGADMNPLVTITSRIPRGHLAPLVAAQLAGAFAGVAAANLMFDLPPFFASQQARHGIPQWLSEAVATFGLIATIRGCARRRPGALPFAVGAYIGAAYWFTASTSFANPAVTLARCVTDTFAGIRPVDVPGFAAAQVVGAAAAVGVMRWLEGAPMKTVVFACVHNAGRSQMAAAFFNALADPAKARAISAGTEPGPSVHLEVVEAMRELGIDLSAVRPRRLTPELAAGAQLLVTMGCGEACPAVPGAAREDWPLPDPKGQPLERVREIRDEIRRRVAALIDAC